MSGLFLTYSRCLIIPDNLFDRWTKKKIIFPIARCSACVGLRSILGQVSYSLRKINCREADQKVLDRYKLLASNRIVSF